MKKLIALTVCASLVLPSAVFAAESMERKQTAAAVSGATEVTTPTKPAPVKPATPTTKPAAPAAKPVAPKPVVKPTPAVKSEYKDGVYVAYGNAYSKGTEGARVTIKGGKITDVELLRTSPKLIDRDARNNYKGLWFAYEAMKKRFIGKTRAEAAKADVVSGATRSCEGWKMSVDRAFERALKAKTDAVYFAGEHMGIDSLGKYMVFAKYDKTRLLGVKVYPLDAKGNALEAAAMSPEQLKAAYTMTSELSYNGFDLKPVKGYEKDTTAVLNALWDAEQNAKITNSVQYIDGFYSAYGAARDKGVERADIYIRNGKLVDVKLYRLGSNLMDRGNTAYAAVVAANAPMIAKLLENGSYIKNYDDKVDSIAGATESSHSWNLAVERAFEKALKVKAEGKYFEGTFAGADNLSNVLVLVDISAGKVNKVTAFLFGSDKKLMKEETLTAGQKELVAKLNAGLAKDGTAMVDITGDEVLSKAAKAAFEDAMLNASKVQGKYKDGVFTSYGHTYDKGSNRADVTLRNGKIVDLKLSRVGQNLVDRGETAYAEVVKNLPGFISKFWAAATKENVQKIDVVSGATASGDGFKFAIDSAYKKAEIVEGYKAAYLNGEHPGTDSSKSVYIIATVEQNVPVKFQVFYLNELGKVKAEDTLSAEEKAVKAEIEAPSTEVLHKYGYKPAVFGANDAEKALSAKVVEAINSALENAGR